MMRSWRRAGGSRDRVVRWLLQEAIGRWFWRLFEVGNTGVPCAGGRRLGRSRWRSLIGGLILGLALVLAGVLILLRIRAGAQDRRAIVVKQMEIVNGRKELLRREGFVGKSRVRAIDPNQVKGVTRENDLCAIGKQQDKIDVEDSKLCVGRRKVELEMRPGRYLDNVDRARRRTVNRRNDALYCRRERDGCRFRVIRRLRQRFGFSPVRLGVGNIHCNTITATN